MSGLSETDLLIYAIRDADLTCETQRRALEGRLMAALPVGDVARMVTALMDAVVGTVELVEREKAEAHEKAADDSEAANDEIVKLEKQAETLRNKLSDADAQVTALEVELRRCDDELAALYARVEG